MAGSVKNLWECKANGRAVTLNKDGKQWRVSVTSKDGSTKCESFESIGSANAAYHAAAHSIWLKK